MGAAAMGTAVGKGVRPPQFASAAEGVAARRRGVPGRGALPRRSEQHRALAVLGLDGGREILPSLGGLALGAVQAAGGRQHLGVLGR